MNIDTKRESELGVEQLVAGIVHDAGELFVQQLTLFRVEIRNEVGRISAALGRLMAGALLLLVATLLIGIGGAHLLSWCIADLPLWAGYAIVGTALAVVGGLLIWWGTSALGHMPILPDQSLDALKENIQWKLKK